MIHLIYGCITAALIIAVGVALILSCLNIYHSGPHPYSADSIEERFDRIDVLVYIAAAAIAGGIILSLALPLEKQRPKAVRDELAALDRLKKKTGVLDADEAKKAGKEPKLRHTLRWGTALIFAALMVYPAIYFLESSHFSISNLNQDIIHAVATVLIPALVGLLLTYGCSLLEQRSICRETELYKALIAARKGQPAPEVSPTPTEKQSKKAWLLSVRCAIIMVAVCFIILGILNGGNDDVLAKAIAICTECIGLG